MTTQRFTRRVLALVLVFCLGLPQAAFALRAASPQEAGAEQLLRAGMERESAFEQRIDEKLDSLRFKAERRLKVGVPPSEISGGYLNRKLVALADAFLDHPNPFAARGEVRDLMNRITYEILIPIQKTASGRLSPEMQKLRDLAVILPFADDWLFLAYSQVRNAPGSFERRTRALAIYSRRAAALAWGRNGPHLRADFVPSDWDDIRFAPILLRAFLPEAQSLLDKVRRGEKLSKRRRRRAEEYAGILFNGLIVPGENGSWRAFTAYRRFFRDWAVESNGRLRGAIGLAVQSFPEKFPLEPGRMPDFLRFAHSQFARQEINSLREYNRSNPSWPLTLWQLTAGTGWTESYIRYLNDQEPGPLERNSRLMERVYGHVLEQGLGAALQRGAGVEESPSVVRRRLGDALNDLREEAGRELRQDIQWPREVRSPRNRLHFLFRVFLLHPSPYGVRDRVRNLLKRIDSNILPDLRRVDDWAEFLPKADDWLGFQLSYPVTGEVFKQMTRALAIYSEEASAKMFARQGAHLRADFVAEDWADIETASVLMRGFLPRLINLLDQVERGDRENEAEARRTAAALFNGLMIPSRNGNYSLSEYKGYFARWVKNLEFIADPEAVLGRAARAFPDLFPENPDRIPMFLEFQNRQFLHEEMETIVRYNREQPPTEKVTLWGLVAGDEAARGYMRIYSQAAKDGAKRELLRRVYEYLLQRGREALALTSVGAEGKGGLRFNPVDMKGFFLKTRKPRETFWGYYRKYFRRWHSRVVEGPDGKGLYLVLWRELNRERGAEKRTVRHPPFLEDVIYEVASAFRVNAAEVLIPTAVERKALAERYAFEAVEPQDISLRRLVSSYTAEDVKREDFEPDPKKAFTRAFVGLGLLARVWDLHAANTALIPETRVPLYFDFEEGLNHHYEDIEVYTEAFLLNFFHPKLNPVPVRLERLLEKIDWKEWRAALRDAEELDLETLRDQVKGSIAAGSFEGRLPEMISDRIDGYFRQLRAHQRTLRSDAKTFLKHAAAQIGRDEIHAAPSASDGSILPETVRAKLTPMSMMARAVALVKAEFHSDIGPDPIHPGRQIVVVEASLLRHPEVPLLMEALEESGLFRGRVVVWGDEESSPEGAVRPPQGVPHFRDSGEMESFLFELAKQDLQTVTYLGRRGHEVSQAVDAVSERSGRDIAFIRPEWPSLLAFFAGLGASQNLLERLATDPELSTVLNVQL